MTNAELIAKWETILDDPLISEYVRHIVTELIVELRSLDA